MTSVAQWSLNKRTLIVAVLAASLWLFLQKGCVPDPEAIPGHAMSVVVLAVQDDAVLYRQGQAVLINIAVPLNIKDEKRAELSNTPSQSLRYASILLRKAADVLETNEVLAVQFIRQVISILKYRVIPSLVESNEVLVPIDLSADQTEIGVGGVETVGEHVNNNGSTKPSQSFPDATRAS